MSPNKRSNFENYLCEENYIMLGTVNRDRIRSIGTEIYRYLVQETCKDPPNPFVLEGKMIERLNMKKNEFFLGISQLIEYDKIRQVTEGKRRYYYVSEMVLDFRDKKLR